MEENTWCLKPSSQQDRARGQLLAAVARALALAEGERLEAPRGLRDTGRGRGHQAQAKAEGGGVWPKAPTIFVIVILELCYYHLISVITLSVIVDRCVSLHQTFFSLIISVFQCSITSAFV